MATASLCLATQPTEVSFERNGKLSTVGVGIILYLEYQSVWPFVRIGSPLSPPPHQVCPPLEPRGGGGGAKTARGWGGVGTPSDDWHSVYSVLSTIFSSISMVPECRCWSESGTGTRGPSLVPEISGTRLRCCMPKYRCRRHRPRWRCSALDIFFLHIRHNCLLSSFLITFFCVLSHDCCCLVMSKCYPSHACCWSLNHHNPFLPKELYCSSRIRILKLASACISRLYLPNREKKDYDTCQECFFKFQGVFHYVCTQLPPPHVRKRDLWGLGLHGRVGAS